MHAMYTVYRESFEAEKFCSKLYMQTFTKKLSRNLSSFLLNPYLDSAILNFHIKKFFGHAKKHKNCDTFLPQSFHGIQYCFSLHGMYISVVDFA